jgi:hypothetical protein
LPTTNTLGTETTVHQPYSQDPLVCDIFIPGKEMWNCIFDAFNNTVKIMLNWLENINSPFLQQKENNTWQLYQVK